MPNKKRDSRQKKIAEGYGINYISIPVNPFIPPTNEQVEYFFNILNNPKNLPVLVYCWHGQDRTGIMTALYRMKKDGWTFDQAYSEMLKNGFHPHIFPKQKAFLINYIHYKKD